MMEYPWLILLLGMMFLTTYWVLFVSNKKKNGLLKEILIENIREEVSIEKNQKKEKSNVKPEKKYRLNVNLVKYDLYPTSIFHNYIFKRLYIKIIVNNCWIKEPFHTKFTQLLYFIDANNLWIKSPKSKKIILNMRDKNNQLKKTISMKVVDINEVIFDACVEILSITKSILEDEQIQGILLSTVIFILEKSNQVKLICKNKDINYKNKMITYSCLSEIFFAELTNVSRKNLSPSNNSNYNLIIKITDDIINNTEEYPNSIPVKKSELFIDFEESILPKKRLISIE